ncbi:hypothetical protein PAPYR_4679 [Paratrimastix pyriformis]|uniref:Uncharacterized protein n=1 Tax=Paratrimastix pyriformis TaxID=342808 RepID=A0ABQ8URM2_9EUKA|nr:hypothetical protein PAPYR_4679 [Paratrimastix pyriformis]
MRQPTTPTTAVPKKLAPDDIGGQGVAQSGAGAIRWRLSTSPSPTTAPPLAAQKSWNQMTLEAKALLKVVQGLHDRRFGRLPTPTSSTSPSPATAPPPTAQKSWHQMTLEAKALQGLLDRRQGQLKTPKTNPTQSGAARLTVDRRDSPQFRVVGINGRLQFAKGTLGREAGRDALQPPRAGLAMKDAQTRSKAARGLSHSEKSHQVRPQLGLDAMATLEGCERHAGNEDLSDL